MSNEVPKPKRRVFKDGEYVRVVKDISGVNHEDIGLEGRIVGYRKGAKYPYMLDCGIDCNWQELKRIPGPAQVRKVTITNTKIVTTKSVIKKKRNIVMNIRQKLHELALSKDEKLLRKHGIVSEFGHLSDLGRRVVMDVLFEDKDLRAAVVKNLEAVEADEKKSSK